MNPADASSGSTVDTIAEGFDRNGREEVTQSLSIAKGAVVNSAHSCTGCLTETI